MQNSKIKFCIVMNFLFCILLGIISIDKSIISILYVLICIWALRGPKQAIQSLSINYAILLLSPVIYQLPTEVSWLRWLVLLIAGLRVIPLVSKSVLSLLVSLVVFYLV